MSDKRRISSHLRQLLIEQLDARVLFAVSAEAQEFVYQLNMARHDPNAYSLQQELGVDLSDVEASPPLAVNSALGVSAQFHASELATHNYFGHQSDVTGDWPNKMARDAGYDLPSHWPDDSNQVESLAAGTLYDTAAEAVDALIIDAGVPGLGHRLQLLSIGDFYRGNQEIGVGHAENNQSTYTHYWAAHLARTGDPDNFLTGVVYDDANQNGRYDAGEGIGGVSVAVGAATVSTNEAGGWSIVADDGSHVVRVVDATAGIDSAAVVDVLGQNVEVDFRVGDNHPAVAFSTYVNRGPTANDDSFSVRAGSSSELVVLENDLDDDGRLAVDSILVTQQPTNGSLAIGSDGIVTYTPAANFAGTDSFKYKVLDDDGVESTAATVELDVTVVGSAWTNPTDAYDVDGNGRVEPLDVLLIINRLNATGPQALPDPPEGPPPYFDVSGDGRIAPIDALQVVNRINGTEANGECSDCQSEADALLQTALFDSFFWSLPVIRQ
ncbi:MAG: hypothetical protein ACI9G1_003862 [Pirellulaceae bacterium]